ncbi:Putative membrane-associated, eicosanoid/glutathione metabolism (MAPEG) protein [Septoria linicola]|uniref:Membrane-associated, eicosanoid/glutathione metabolism (MAPEG) protein n=1 Tax=Septoria linicola TaxID=215465 RepID=A0A9Q9EQM3_9PEZI|nr:Putative membrane-associated, eicosanoid/glutathione metabolism (MAPEG) protein [Septoria linicola]
MSNRRDFPNADEAKAKAQEGKDTLVHKLQDDGVEDPAGLAMFGFGGLFLAAIPLTSWITQPNSIIEKAVNGVVGTVGFLASAGSSSAVPQTGKIAALAGLYVTVTYALSGAGSAAGVAAGNKEGRDNLHPRAQVKNLRGLPLRLHSAHYHLMEMFPGFAISAALAQAMAPGDQTLINLLGLHVIAKCFIHYPSYVFNLGTPRTLSHVVATASVINVALRLAKKPLI